MTKRFNLKLLLVSLLAGAAWQSAKAQPARSTADYLRTGSQEVARLVSEKLHSGRARNVIIFIGDGMGVSTLTAARIHQGQMLGRDGESFATAMDGLPHSALVKTYSHDGQVPDSAPTATAILSGVKANNGTIGVGPEATVRNCRSSKGRELVSLLSIAQAKGKRTGVVSTARITHATPAAAYAHTPWRLWESDADLTAEAKTNGCIDIARQLIEGPVGSKINVLFGGGRSHFLPTSMRDPEHQELSGKRTDGRNLIEDWKRRHPRGSFVYDDAEFKKLGGATGNVLGLFAWDDMSYEADRLRDTAGEPSLAAMTRTAIDLLGRDSDGFVLVVEGGRIDHAHHDGNARRALADTIALDQAVQVALERTNARDTLVVVTSDHSHTLTIGGYPVRGNPILGVVVDRDGKSPVGTDGLPFTTLGYANGPGAAPSGTRADPTKLQTNGLDYKQQAAVPLQSETHGGEDVAVRASGPMSHLFRGTIEQHSIFHIVAAAMDGPGRSRRKRPKPSD